MRLLPLVALLAACNPDVNVNKRDIDADGDGYTTDVDCDDAHATVNPDATEVCDGLDNDCDTTVDEDVGDATTWYADADGDGHGDAGAATVACEAPADAVTEADDCDDADATAFPGAAEVCNGTDDDCDGSVDEDAEDVGTFYADADGDGYGDPITAVTACEASPDEVADGTDCDDADAAIHPDAAEADCDDPVDYNCDGSVGYADADGDGVAACEDCDDTDAGRSPLLPEVCDEADTDEDCDAVADTEDPSADPATWSIWYRDGDGDTYGDAASSVAACDLPAGYVTNDDDCDDTSSGVSPADSEVCDAANVDEDCDGAADDSDSAASGKATWYLDADADTYGDAATTTSACDAPSGYVTNDDDCNDTSSGVSPADSEVCDAANVDEDCDGAADDSDTAASGKATWYLDADADTYGVSTTTLSRCDQPSSYVTVSTDCDDVHADAFPGGIEVCGDDVDQDCSGADEECSSTAYDGDYDVEDGDHVKIYGPTTDDWFGEALVGGDFDGDGVGDLVVGSSRFPTYGYEGTVVGYYGPFTAGIQAPTTYDDFLYGASTFAGSQTFGQQVRNLGDLDGDGDDELLAYFDVGDEWLLYEGGDSGSFSYLSGEDGYFPSCTNAARGGSFDATAGGDWFCADEDYLSARGAVYLYSALATSSSATITGEAINQYAGTSLAGGGDIDGDGVDDLVVGAPYLDSATIDIGAAYVVYGPVSGSLGLASADLKMTGTYESDMVGNRAVLPGDSDGDGYDDLVVSAPYASPTGYGEGTIYVVTTPGSGAIETYADGKVVGNMGMDTIGMEALDAGDFDGDGTIDVLVSSYDDNTGGANAGAVYVAYGPISGTVDLTTDGARWIGTNAGDYLGYAVAAVPDSDGDGKDEIAMGGMLHDYASDATYVSNRGAVWIWLGQ